MIGNERRSALLRGLALGAGLALLLLTGGVAQAGEGDPCKMMGNGAAVPDCTTVTHADTLKRDHTQDINIQCPAAAPYYWEGWSDTFTSVWHVITENILVEDAHHAHFKISNTRLGSTSYSVTIGCSPLAEGGSCKGVGTKTKDPGCPESDRRATCIPDEGGFDCWDEWTETCTSGSSVTTYFCSTASFLPTCYSCSG
jgi:hypothetical protein